jgi:putative CocE/NonD family hydrolase
MASQCRDPLDNAKLLEVWAAHPDKDEWWDQEDTTLHFAEMDVPCFTQASWYDYMCLGSVGSFIGRQHHGGPNSRGNSRLLVGPWTHGPQVSAVGELLYPPSATWDITAHMLAWFDHHLKGVPDGVALPAAEPLDGVPTRARPAPVM